LMFSRRESESSVFFTIASFMCEKNNFLMEAHI
jgi:hypothetical protein